MLLNMKLYNRCFRSLEIHFGRRMEFRYPITILPLIIISSISFSIRTPVSIFVPRYRYLLHVPTVLSSSECKLSLSFPMHNCFVFDWFIEKPHSCYSLTAFLSSIVNPLCLGLQHLDHRQNVEYIWLYFYLSVCSFHCVLFSISLGLH